MEAVGGVALAPKFQLLEDALLDKSLNVIVLPVHVVVVFTVKSAKVAAQKVELEFIFTVSLDTGQTPLFMLQTKVVIVLLVKPVAVEPGAAEFEKVVKPLAIVQVPEPLTGIFPFKFMVEPLQMLVSFPALAAVGLSAKLMLTLSKLGLQIELLIVHRST